ncbi:PadR family transcriptional regulator [Paenibacillus sp. FJAT-26967]|uniref:PadR family transcriptional regulator n=1 Tax=Paenibacillus sp. FJAT-26967 TaxID=1729690 RepID=UPI000838FDA4|nr:PadR family transcriptional regulator [Paenibacillus sp. FJAT-26967]
MNIQTVILGFLTKESMTGYDMKARVDQSVSHLFEASFGGIYPALKRMEKEGLVDKEIQFQEGKPNRNVFAITDKGRQSFMDYLLSPLAQNGQRSDFLLRFFFASHVPDCLILSWLEQECFRQQKALQGLLSMKAAQEKNPEADPYRMKTLDFGITQVRLGLEWAEKELTERRKAEAQQTIQFLD